MTVGTPTSDAWTPNDLSVDPSESNNIAEKHPDVVTNLRKKIRSWVAEFPDRYEKISDEKRSKEE